MPQHYLIIDLEATCWRDRANYPAPSEIIEIGMVILSAEKKELWSGGWFVRPKLSPILSDFCTELTSITHADVDSAAAFSEVMAQLEKKVFTLTGQAPAEALFVSWGDFDRTQFIQDCALHGYRYPFGDHLNLKLEFMTKRGSKRCGVNKALRILGLTFEGKPHRGVDDARNIARIFCAGS